MEERTITEQAVPVTICPPKISLDKSEAIAKEQKKKKDNLLEQKFSEYCQNLNMFLEGRVFIPEAKEYDVLFLADRLTAFLKERTGINYISYYFERKEVKGIFIMKSEILLDKERQYTYSNDIVYDENGIAYHVSYYEEKGVLRIILDNPDSGNDFRIVESLADFSHLKPEKNLSEEIQQSYSVVWQEETQLPEAENHFGIYIDTEMNTEETTDKMLRGCKSMATGAILSVGAFLLGWNIFLGILFIIAGAIDFSHGIINYYFKKKKGR